MNVKLKRAAALVLASTMMLSLAGCSLGNDEDKDPLLDFKKQELVDMVNTLNANVVEQQEEIERLETLLEGIQGEETETSGITTMEDGYRKTFTSLNDVITLPVELNYPGSVQSPNTSSINISSNVKVNPTSNWICTLNGTTLELNHSTKGISGKITVGTLGRDAQKATSASDLQDYLNENFFSELPASTATYSRLHIGSLWVGVDAKESTFIDSEDAMIRCGLLGYGEVSVQYMFVYKGTDDADNNEAIMALMSTLQVMNSQLSIIDG